MASMLVAFPTGDQQAKMVGQHQPVTLAAMEGRFVGGSMASVAVIGQPNVAARRLDNPIEIPGALSFLAYGHFGSNVHGLDDYPKESWPDNIELLYYSFHLMITLGTIFIVLMAYAGIQNLRGRLESSRGLLWVLMLAFPFPYIANTLGWMTAELGRQPWLVYGLFRTSDGASKVVSSGDTVFTLIGFVGLYFVLGVLFLVWSVARSVADPVTPDRPNLERSRPYDRGMVWNCWLHAHRLRGAGRPQLRRWNPPLACGQDATGAPTGHRRDRSALVLARSVAGRFRRHIARGIPHASGIRLCRVLPRALPHPVVFDIARNLAGSRRPHQRPHVAGVLGFRLRTRQYASGHPVRRGGGQSGPRCSAGFRRHVLHGLLHRFHATRRRGTARLVYGLGCALRCCRARGARRDLSHAQDGRSGA